MLAYDSYKYVKKLVSTDVPEKQAKIHAEQIKEILESNLATKQDIAEIHAKIDTRTSEVEVRLINGL